jgi:hypothetical protein
MDLQLDDNGDILIPTRAVLGFEAIAQRCVIRTLTFLGEWILDSRAGVPWHRWLDRFEPPLGQIEGFLTAEYEGVEGVVAAVVEATYDPTTYIIHISGRVQIEEADTIELQLGIGIEASAPHIIYQQQVIL